MPQVRDPRPVPVVLRWFSRLTLLTFLVGAGVLALTSQAPFEPLHTSAPGVDSSADQAANEGHPLVRATGPPAVSRYDDPHNFARAPARQVAYRLAPNTAGLSLPFRNAGLRSQVDDVVQHFDDFGTPPTGIAQGGLKGYPKGTYGGQGLPSRSLGYYTESDVWISGGGIKRGAERLVFGRGGEVYYTPTHYDDFVRIR